MRRLLIILYLLLASPAFGAVAYDNVATGEYAGGEAPFTFTWNHTNKAGNYLTVGLCYPADAITATGVDYGGQAMSLVTTISRAELWELKAPATGTVTITVTMEASQNVFGGSMTFTGVDQTTPSGTAGTDASGDPSSTTVTGVANGLAMDVMCATSNPTLTPGGSQISRYNAASANTTITGAGSTQSGTGTLTFSWSGAGANGTGLIAIPLNPATTARRPIAPIVMQ